MADQILTISFFNGGISSGSKNGVRGSFGFGSGLDIHKDPNLLQVQPASTKESSTTVTDLPLFGTTNTVNDNAYFLGDAGKVYKRTSTGTWSVLTTYTNAEGIGFFSGTNLVYFNSADQQYTLDPATDSITSYRALNSSTWHPVESFLDKVFTGNGRELISTDASAIDYTSSTIGGGITIDYNYQIKCLKNIGNWLFIGATSDNSSNARYFLWDGYSDNYNYARSLKEDGINAVEIGDDGTVLIFAGKKGNIYQLTSVDAPLLKLKTLPKIEKDKTVEVYPGSTANYQGFPVFGISNGTTVTGERGVYSWASIDKNFPKVLNYDFLPSTGTTTGTTLQIGAVLTLNSTDLLIGWRDDTTYGVDLIDGTGVQGTAIYESLIHDAGAPFVRKHYKYLKVKLAGDLATGEKVNISYKGDRASSWTKLVNGTNTDSLDYAVDGAVNEERFSINKKYYEAEFKISIESSGSTAASVDSIVVVFEAENLI
jgi:hypothetical protein